MADLDIIDLALTRTIAAEVASARSSEEVFALLASGQCPDVILLDINLAGESGTDVARRLADGGAPRPYLDHRGIRDRPG